MHVPSARRRNDVCPALPATRLPLCNSSVDCGAHSLGKNWPGDEKLGKPSNVQGQWRQSRDNGLCRLSGLQDELGDGYGFEPIGCRRSSSLSSGRVQAGRFAGAEPPCTKPMDWARPSRNSSGPTTLFATRIRPVLILTPLAVAPDDP